MKKLIVGLGVFAFALVVAGAAQAGSITKINDSSSGLISYSKLIKVLLTNNNGAQINNSSVTSSASSGSNSVVSADDQSGTTVNTGTADSATGAGNVANTNSVDEDYETGCDCSDSIDDVNDDSTADITSEDELNNEIENNNDVEVNNDVTSDGDSGSNSVVSGDSLTTTNVGTGNSSSATLVENLFNTNLKKIFRSVVR